MTKSPLCSCDTDHRIIEPCPNTECGIVRLHRTDNEEAVMRTTNLKINFLQVAKRPSYSCNSISLIYLFIFIYQLIYLLLFILCVCIYFFFIIITIVDLENLDERRMQNKIN